MDSISTLSRRPVLLSATRAAPRSIGQLNVAIVSDAAWGRNGVGTYYPDLMAQLASRVGALDLVCPTDPPDAELERFSIPMPGDRSQRVVWPRVGELQRRLDRSAPHLVVIPALGPFSYFALAYARRRRIPFALVHHTDFEQLLSLYWSAAISRPLRWFLPRAYSWAIRRASAVAALDTEGLEQTRRLGASEPRILGTPLSPEFVTVPTRPARPNLRRCIFVGRLAAEKGVRELLAAARTMPDLEFRIAGDGPLRALVDDVAASAPNVHALGWLGRQRVREEIDAADVLVLPSTVETFGTVALEALARRRYVVVRRSCGIANWPSIARGLFFVEPEEDIAGALTRLRALPHAGREASARRSWDAVRAFNASSNDAWLGFMGCAAGVAPAAAVRKLEATG